MSIYTSSVSMALLIAMIGLLIYLQSKQVKFNHRVFLSLVLGVILGFVSQLLGDASDNVTNQSLNFIGNGYFALLKMLVVPLILTSIIHSILNIGDASGKILRALSIRSVAMLLGMTALASGIAIAVGLWFHVGQGLQLPTDSIVPTHHYTGFVDTLLGMIPSNPVAAMSNENTVAIVLFAVLLGVSAMLIYRQQQEKVESFRSFISAAFEVVKQLTRLVLAITPYGVLALIAHVTATQGIASLEAILNFIAAMYVAMVLVLVMHLLILMLRGVKPWHYLANAYPALLVAFTTRSSFGTLPVTEEILKNRFNLRQVTSTFVPSVGATLGMNACAGIFPAMLVVMVMTIMHLPIHFNTVIAIMMINMVASLGISGIPGTAFVAATVSLSALGLPYAIIGLVQGVDAVVDMGRTATNVNGVMTTAIVVDGSIKT